MGSVCAKRRDDQDEMQDLQEQQKLFDDWQFQVTSSSSEAEVEQRTDFSDWQFQVTSSSSVEGGQQETISSGEWESEPATQQEGQHENEGQHEQYLQQQQEQQEQQGPQSPTSPMTPCPSIGRSLARGRMLIAANGGKETFSLDFGFS